MSERDISEKRIGDAAGKAAGREVSSSINGLRSEIKTTNSKLERLDKQINSLQTETHELRKDIKSIEQTKARAKREATEDLREQLQEKVETKKQEYYSKVGDVLEDYRGSIERIKDRFLNSIADRSEYFQGVEDEFEAVRERRTELTAANDDLDQPGVDAYQRRIEAINRSRGGFLDAIDGFLADREETAETIESLQTPIPGVNGVATVQIPFWIVGIERGGQEELLVWPIQDRTSHQEPTLANPYASYLSEHETHAYGHIASTVHSYVQRDVVRDSLASGDPAFADPRSVFQGNKAVHDRFVEALEEYELARRSVTSTGSNAGGRSRTRASSSGTTEDVTTDD